MPRMITLHWHKRVASPLWVGGLALIATLLACTGRAAAQPRRAAPLLSAASYQLEIAGPRSHELPSRPSFVAPLIVTVAGASVGAGALLVGVLGTMGDCGGASSSGGTPPPGAQSAGATSATTCDRGIPAPYLVTAAVGGGVAVLGGVWLVERLIARGEHNREIRQRASSLRVLPTFGGAALVGRF